SLRVKRRLRADRSCRVATNVLAALTGSASRGLSIALNALGNAYMELAAGKDTDSVKQEEGPTNILGALVRQSRWRQTDAAGSHVRLFPKRAHPRIGSRVRSIGAFELFSISPLGHLLARTNDPNPERFLFRNKF